MSFLITVDWPGEGSSAPCVFFTKDAFSLTLTTDGCLNEWPYSNWFVCLSACECVRVCLHFQ